MRSLVGVERVSSGAVHKGSGWESASMIVRRGERRSVMVTVEANVETMFGSLWRIRWSKEGPKPKNFQRCRSDFFCSLKNYLLT